MMGKIVKLTDIKKAKEEKEIYKRILARPNNNGNVEAHSNSQA